MNTDTDSDPDDGGTSNAEADQLTRVVDDMEEDITEEREGSAHDRIQKRGGPTRKSSDTAEGQEPPD